LGWDDLISNPNDENTCAIRASLALVKSKVAVRGRLVVRKGAHRGARIEPGQARLARMLAEAAYFGKPEVFPRNAAAARIGGRKGVVAFWNIPGYMNGRGGHIDIIDGAAGARGSDCYWNASEMGFWEMH
jgi:hypothetical protein